MQSKAVKKRAADSSDEAGGTEGEEENEENTEGDDSFPLEEELPEVGASSGMSEDADTTSKPIPARTRSATRGAVQSTASAAMPRSSVRLSVRAPPSAAPPPRAAPSPHAVPPPRAAPPRAARPR